MKKKKLQRLLALVLALTFIFGGSLTVGAEDEDPGSITDKTIADIKAQLNADSYEVYKQEYFADVPRATEKIEIAGVDYTKFVKGSTNKDVAVNGDMLFTPATGTVTWTVTIPSTARYSIVIEYLPDDEKTASIERILKIDGKIPFAEARFLTLPKTWQNQYVQAKAYATKEASVSDIQAAALAAGFAAAEIVNENGESYVRLDIPAVWTSALADFVNKYTVRFFTADIDNNELRPSMMQTPVLSTYELRDADGFYAESFEFVFEAGTRTISLEAVNEPMSVKSITLIPHVDLGSYENYLAQYQGVASGKDTILIQAEYAGASSSQTIYPIEDRTDAATMPSDTTCTILNTIGGEKWQTAGQWVRYTFKVNSSGMYNIAARYRQNVLDGMYVCRSLRIASNGVEEGADGYYDGSVPFLEASQLRFNYNSSWQSTLLNSGATNSDGDLVNYQFYFKEGVEYTVTFEVGLGSTGDIVRRVDAALTAINNDYLAIMKLTGADPDEYRDYGFSRVMPDVMIDMIIQSRELYAIAEELVDIAGEKSSNVATLEKVAWLLDRMGTNEDEIAKYLDQLKSYIGSLGTWVSDAKTQPLQLDYLVVQPLDSELPRAKASFWKALVHELSSFIMSFFRNYDRMGATTEDADAETTIDVWLAYGRDQAQVIRNLINNDFTPESQLGTTVNLKLVAGGTLLPSVLAGMGPDVYIGLGEDSVINYAIRGALLPVENMSDFDGFVEQNFNDAAMAVLGIEDSEGIYHCYGLPETQTFTMMFVREDILADLGIEIPKTWDHVLAAIPTLQANNMQIGMHQDYKIFLYQMGGTLFADNGMRINLDSNVGLEAFDTMCSFFTMYSFPKSYDFANRFRTGEMPIGFASYNATYNQLIVFATEIKGLWNFYPMPGIETTREDGSTYINNVSVATTSAIVMLNGCGSAGGEAGELEKARAWEFMKWHAGAQCQIDYSNEMVAIIGPSAKHATANIQALDQMPWTSAEYEQLSKQFERLASIPNYPGSYIIGRYTSFAFLAAYNDNADPTEELQSYITIINKEITRKREEFGLETLEIGQTLLSKRLDQLKAAWDEDVKSLGDESSQVKAAEPLMREVLDDIEREDYDLVEYHTLTDILAKLKAQDATAFAGTIKAIENAILVLA
ncbi:MAG: extracellular solute-binding protein [Clostridia bacterium]|nr:extracellular solute-binding protein [Clostridia bacterium]